MTEPLVPDVASSTVSIADRSFPACVLCCPVDDELPKSRTLGNINAQNVYVYIPTESGFLVGVDLQIRDGRLDARLCARTCSRVESICDPGTMLWLPHNLMLLNRTVMPGSQEWSHCEPEWLVEHTDRISTFA